MRPDRRFIAAAALLGILAIGLAAKSIGQETGEQPSALPSVIHAKVAGVADGDTLRVTNPDKSHVTVRLDGIDAPEMTQPFGHEAQKRLAELATGQVVIQWKAKDKNGRLLGIVYKDNKVINRELVVEGFAWTLKDSKSPALADAEKLARRDGVGLWRDANPIPPWDWRGGVRPPEAPRAPPVAKAITPRPTVEPRQEASAVMATPVESTVYVTKTGSKYHRAGCQYLSKSSIPVSLSRAVSGYSPCSRCNPPRE